ncbi:ABC transporter substrate-binding protein [Pendulispora brunnea]|uniref:ABC transporter substrate-binding protein n=1 Tax=Pendulispora brunnea TaxID=2905690 RepID=A0ABZ2JUA6_9BACT
MRYARALVMALLAIGGAAGAGCKDKEPEKAAPQTAETKTSAAPASDTIVIGHVGSMTGNEATFGQSSDNGMKLAVEEQNKKNGIKGKKIVLKTYDDQGKPEEAAVAATRLVTQDKVLTFLGEVSSSRSIAMGPVADSNKIPMISNSSTNPKVTKDGDKTRPFVFRVCFIDPFQGTVMAKFAAENKKWKKVAILRDVGNDYSVGLANFFTETFKKLGGEVVDDVSYKAGDQDFKAQLTKLKSKNAEAFYVPGYYTDVALIARQAKELGIKVPLMGGDGWDSEKLYEISKGALDGSFFSNHYSPEDTSPQVKDFIAKYKATYNAVPDAHAVLGYDAANVAFHAMEQAKELTGPAIRDEVEKTKDFQGVSGKITLNKDHNADKPAVVIGIEKNAPKYAATISP